MNVKKPIYTVPAASTEFTKEAYLDCSGLNPTIWYEYESCSKIIRSGIRFNTVSAFRHRGERYCSAWHIDKAYDTLVIVEKSLWLSEVRSDISEIYRDNWNAYHYMIYLDSVGCFEILATSWEVVHEEIIHKFG